ncbi:MAG: hypothetical protein SOI26_07555 [Coriobacteriales bacterium]|jgi:hypothetical protein
MQVTRRTASKLGLGLVAAIAFGGALASSGLGTGTARAYAQEATATDAATSDVKWPDPQEILSTKTFAADGSVATQQILASAKGTYNVLPLWMGLADTVCDSPSGMNGSTDLSADTFRTSGLFGTYASPANAEPNPYMSNLFYSYVDPSAGLSAVNRDEIALVCSGQPTAADTTVAIGGTSNSLYYRPDLVIGGNQAGDTSTGAAAYVALVQAINDGSIGEDNYVEGDETYNPYLMDGWNSFAGNGGYQGTVRGTEAMLYNIADVVDAIKADDPTKVTAYGDDARGMAETFENAFLGAQAEVLKMIEEGTVARRTIACVTSVDADTQTAQIAYSDPSVQLGNENVSSGYAPQYALQDITDNLAWVLSGGATPTDTAEGPAASADGAGAAGGRGGQGGGQGGQGGGAGAAAASSDAVTYEEQPITDPQGAAGQALSGTVVSGGSVSTAPGGTITISLAELAQADVAIYTAQNTSSVAESDVEAAFAAAGTVPPLGIYVNPTNVGTGNYDADKSLFTLSWIGSVYPELAYATDMVAYFYSQIAHVSDDYLANVIALNCASMTLVGDDTLQHDNAYYQQRVAGVQQVIDEGVEYLVANLDAIVAEHVNLAPVVDSDGVVRNTSLGL